MASIGETTVHVPANVQEVDNAIQTIQVHIQSSDNISQIIDSVTMAAEGMVTDDVPIQNIDDLQVVQDAAMGTSNGTPVIMFKWGSQKKPFRCQICDMSFQDASMMCEHMSKHGEDSFPQKPFPCTVCPKSFSSAKSLERHTLTHYCHTLKRCKFCYKVFVNKENLEKHILTHGGMKPHRCEECGEQFVYRQGLETHRLTHTGDRPFVCQLCSKGFNRKDILERHMQVHNKDGKKYKCVECNKTFSHKFVLKRHARAIHSGEEEGATCSVCNKYLRSKENLGRHMKIHSGHRPFKCETCDRAFTQKQHLIDHAVLHTGEMPHQCQHCHMTFKHRRSLARHQLKHQAPNFTCHQCPQAFLEASELEKHKRKHDLLKFQCPHCHTLFKLNTSLQRHLWKCNQKPGYSAGESSQKSCNEMSTTTDDLHMYAEIITEWEKGEEEKKVKGGKESSPGDVAIVHEVHSGDANNEMTSSHNQDGSGSGDNSGGDGDGNNNDSEVVVIFLDENTGEQMVLKHLESVDWSTIGQNEEINQVLQTAIDQAHKESEISNKAAVSVDDSENIADSNPAEREHSADNLASNKTVISGNTTLNVAGNKTILSGNTAGNLASSKTVVSGNTLGDLASNKAAESGKSGGNLVSNKAAESGKSGGNLVSNEAVLSGNIAVNAVGSKTHVIGNNAGNKTTVNASIVHTVKSVAPSIASAPADNVSGGGDGGVVFVGGVGGSAVDDGSGGVGDGGRNVVAGCGGGVAGGVDGAGVGAMGGEAGGDGGVGAGGIGVGADVGGIVPGASVVGRQIAPSQKIAVHGISTSGPTRGDMVKVRLADGGNAAVTTVSNSGGYSSGMGSNGSGGGNSGGGGSIFRTPVSKPPVYEVCSENTPMFNTANIHNYVKEPPVARVIRLEKFMPAPPITKPVTLPKSMGSTIRLQKTATYSDEKHTVLKSGGKVLMANNKPVILPKFVTSSKSLPQQKPQQLHLQKSPQQQLQKSPQQQLQKSQQQQQQQNQLQHSLKQQQQQQKPVLVHKSGTGGIVRVMPPPPSTLPKSSMKVVSVRKIIKQEPAIVVSPPGKSQRIQVLTMVPKGRGAKASYIPIQNLSQKKMSVIKTHGMTPITDSSVTPIKTEVVYVQEDAGRISEENNNPKDHKNPIQEFGSEQNAEEQNDTEIIANDINSTMETVTRDNTDTQMDVANEPIEVIYTQDNVKMEVEESEGSGDIQDSEMTEGDRNMLIQTVIEYGESLRETGDEMS